MRLLSVLFTLFAIILISAPGPLRAQPADFSGDWQTFWRNGGALLSLTQEGDRVTGTYQPDNGEVEGTVDGNVLLGLWKQPGASGTFVFALSEDRQVLTGRFGNGEYWNGFRDDAEDGSSTWELASGTPRETLRSLLLAANAAIHGGDVGALRLVNTLVTFAGPPTTARDMLNRRTIMFDILDMSTLRIMDVPQAPASPEDDTVRFDIGPAGVPDETALTFRQDSFGRWRLLLPEADALSETRARLLAALGHQDMEALKRARADSPRAVMREFIQATHAWDEGGRERALAVMDLSHIPERLHALEGPVYADMLMRILNRIAYVIWQEIPDDPTRSVPYVYFQHPVGNITIARVAEPPAEAAAAAADGTAPRERWKIASSTLVSAPALMEAMQGLPPIPGLEQAEALSPYFRLRESVRTAAPALVRDWGYLEAWQWLGLLSAILLAAAALGLTRAAVQGLSRLGSRAEGAAGLGLAAGFVVAAAILSWAIARLGLTQVGLPVIGTVTGLLLTLSIAFFAFRVVSIVGKWFIHRAEQTVSYMDEIAASLGTGLAKLAIVVGAVIAVADVIGLPYEGVIAGLGVGGIAIAFAARDTVSNMMGGGILMADRPFKRGDLIEHEGTLATVEQVGLRSTKLRTLDDTLLHVPNSHLSDRKIANWGKRRRRKTTLQVGLTYDTPREKLAAFVERLRTLLRDSPAVDQEEIYVGLSSFGASSIDIDMVYFFRVNSYSEQVDAQHRLMIDIVALAEDVGVHFAFPTRTVHVTQGAEAQRSLAPGSTVDGAAEGGGGPVAAAAGR